ncbi:MAG: hypothetical protein ABIP35_14850 [Ginsengibacter sp.]
MKNPIVKNLLPHVVLFIAINILLLSFKSFLSSYSIDINFILVANVILFFITFFGFFIQLRSMATANINAFLRGIYSSLIMKMFIVMGAVFVYVLASDGKINKPALFISMGLYIIYTSLEVFQLMKLVRKKPDA